MTRQLVGAAVVVGLYVLILAACTWLTGWRMAQPGQSASLERLRAGHHRKHPWLRLIFCELVIVAIWCLQYNEVNQAARRWFHLSAPAALVALVLLVGVLFTPAQKDGWWFLAGSAGVLAGLLIAAPGTFTLQFVVLLCMLATAGKVARLPVWFGHYQPRYSLISVPLWTVITVNAMLLDVLTQPTDDRMTRVLAHALPGVTQPLDGAKLSFWQTTLYSHQSFSLGLATPIVVSLFMGVMAVWAREYNRVQLVTAPFVCTVFALGMGLLMSGFAHGRWLNVASPWLAAGMITGVVIASVETHLWPLIMDPGQNWHQDQTHKFV